MNSKKTQKEVGEQRFQSAPRRVIQISASIDSVGKYFVVAVCNDGTLWQMGGLYEGEIRWDPIISPPSGSGAPEEKPDPTIQAPPYERRSPA